MEITVKVEGIDAAKRQLAALRRELRETTKHAVLRSMDAVELEIKRKLREKQHAPRTKTPSQPGQPPARISDALALSFTGKGPRWDGETRVVGWVGSRNVYSRAQELGAFIRKRQPHNRQRIIGPHPAGGYFHLPARPYVGPATRAVEDKIRRIFEEETAAAIRAVTSRG